MYPLTSSTEMVVARSGRARLRRERTYHLDRSYSGNYHSDRDSTHNYSPQSRSRYSDRFDHGTRFNPVPLSRRSSSDIVVTELPSPPLSRRTTGMSLHRPQQLEYPSPEDQALQSSLRARRRRRYSLPSVPREERIRLKIARHANTQLPSKLPSFPMYPETYDLMSLAAHYSSLAYTPPPHSDPDWILATVPSPSRLKLSSARTIVLSVRGTAGVSDWLTNLSMHHVRSDGFLPSIESRNTENLYHEGFLNRARNMVRPAARRLRQVLLPLASAGTPCDLLITGHSAGGAVAALLYMHILSEPVETHERPQSGFCRSRSRSRSRSHSRTRSDSPSGPSELQLLAPYLRNIHCISFGAPPVSEMPLVRSKPRHMVQSGPPRGFFLGVVNHGDPVVRLDKAYAKSLLELLAAPSGHQSLQSRWCIPHPELYPAGTLLLLRPPGGGREGGDGRKARNVVAERVGIDDLREVVWGDIRAHAMDIYVDRVKMLCHDEG
ncbi:hypothetical protein BROUX41_006801 [Berkeleyomyces rouxiae]|uniref:uncharacterized protein n=1 Tax=Berkeleyomyces rouxiae TaxID=2035830 RepID=UPI003B7C3B18